MHSLKSDYNKSTSPTTSLTILALFVSIRHNLTHRLIQKSLAIPRQQARTSRPARVAVVAPSARYHRLGPIPRLGSHRPSTVCPHWHCPDVLVACATLVSTAAECVDRTGTNDCRPCFVRPVLRARHHKAKMTTSRFNHRDAQP